MADLPAAFAVHRITVEPFLGHGPYGDVYGPPVVIPCFIRSRVVQTTDASGRETRRTVSVCRVGTSYASTCRLDSRAIVHSDQAADLQSAGKITNVGLNDDGGFGAWQHLRVEVG